MRLSSPNQERILIIDNPAIIDETMTIALAEDNLLCDRAESPAAALERLEEGYDLLIAPAMIDARPATGYIATVQRRYPHTGVIVITDPAEADLGAAALEAGAADYLTTPTTPVCMVAAIRRAIQMRKMKKELSVLRQTVAMDHRFDNLVGVSDAMVRLKETARKLAPTDITVLITGPTGSGKESLARIMHHHSRRRSEAFVAVDFSALPAEKAEALLFGQGDPESAHAHTTDSLLSRADGGTIFLDNVDHAPVAFQPRLAQFLKDFTLDSRMSARRKLDTRVIAAVSADPAELVADGSYNADLYRLLSEIKLNLPPLAERTEDIEMLADYFVRRARQESRREQVEISHAAIDKLTQHSWPGNVRELENCLRRAVALCRNNTLEPHDISFFGAESAVYPRERRILNTKRKSGLLDDTQRSIIARALEDNNWNFTQTAQELGIGRTTLWRKVKKYRLAKETVESEA